jgi:hypothetical protein
MQSELFLKIKINQNEKIIEFLAIIFKTDAISVPKNDMFIYFFVDLCNKKL